MLKKKAARHCCDSDTRQTSSVRDDKIVTREFELGSLYGGLALALMFGACMLHWAVVL